MGQPRDKWSDKWVGPINAINNAINGQPELRDFGRGIPSKKCPPFPGLPAQLSPALTVSLAGRVSNTARIAADVSLTKLSLPNGRSRIRAAPQRAGGLQFLLA